MTVTSPAPKRRRAVFTTGLTTGFAAILAVTGLGLGAAPAHATPPPGATCNPNIESIWDDITSATITPVITEFTSFNITPGTTGQQTQRLSVLNTVTTKINNSADFSAGYKSTLSEVGVKVGFQVANERTSTRTTELSRVVNLNAPGYYGIYRGVLRVDGEWSRYLCARSGAASGYWINASQTGTGQYTTFNFPEEGTVSCPSPEPAGTVRAAARKELCK
ncbi:hypothetical protein [Kitasatospora sp. NPDC002965]|uniref:hypothetical protein n=1 Tax=Kitasatospora sp. NPDC002965 TaxID=3154775 RepID=UPI0033B63A12